MTDKRQYIRHDAIHLLDYLVLDQNADNSGTYSMARTLDVSNNGLKLETVQPFPQGARLKITLGLANELVDLSGTVIYCRSRKGRFISGVTLEGLNYQNRKVFEIYLQAFNRRHMTH